MRILFWLFLSSVTAKICSSRSLLPFSGYKVTRRYRLLAFPWRSESYVVVTTCHKGKALDSRVFQAKSALEEFGHYFCERNGSSVDTAPVYSAEKWRQIRSLPPCLKLARRKRYAKLDIVIFVTLTFVGAIFSCMGETGQEGDFESTKRTTAPKRQLLEPLSPLVADDYSGHWISVSLSPPAIVYNVPFLKSPSLWDRRFASLKWQSQVDAEEQYAYNATESSLANGALLASLRLKQKLMEKKTGKLSWLARSKRSIWSRLDNRLQLTLVLFASKRAFALRIIEKLQQLWDFD